MTKPITPELVAAWRTLQGFAERFRDNTSIVGLAETAKAIDVIDNSDFMVPIENEGLCTYQVGGGYHSPPEYCEAEIDGASEYCPKHQALVDAEPEPDPAEWGDTTREDMDAHQGVGLPTLAPGGEIRPAFSDTHPRAARELGDVIRGEQP